MDDVTRVSAKREIDESLMLSTFSMRRIGLSFDEALTAGAYFRQKLIFIASVCGIFAHVFSELVNIILTFYNSPRVEDVVPLLHTFGYGALSKNIVGINTRFFLCSTFYVHLVPLTLIIILPFFEGIAKVFVLWYKNKVFGELIDELASIWPMPPIDEDALIVKKKSVAALRISHRCKSSLKKTVLIKLSTK